MVTLSSRISPFTSTVILRDRSPFATAVVTAAILRTWVVRFDAMKLTLSVRSFHTPARPREVGTEGKLGGQADVRGRAQLIHHCVDGVFEFENFAFDNHGDFLREVA